MDQISPQAPSANLLITGLAQYSNSNFKKETKKKSLEPTANPNGWRRTKLNPKPIKKYKCQYSSKMNPKRYWVVRAWTMQMCFWQHNKKLKILILKKKKLIIIIFWNNFNLWRLFLIITLYHQIQTPINF